MSRGEKSAPGPPVTLPRLGLSCLSGTFSRLVLRFARQTMPLMARITVTFTISLPPEMAEELEEIMKREHRTRSELIREALRRYISAVTQVSHE